MRHINWMLTLIFFCIKLPITVAVVLFAVSNWKLISLELWPLPGVLDVPISLIFMLSLVVGFITGAVIAWIWGFDHNIRANRAEKRLRTLERELTLMRVREEEIRAQLSKSPKGFDFLDKQVS
ncbi:hypothetical protein A1OE_1164 [Candidatus Endolissoclinum faulkneri L2]|uniref:Lipopolysaccharide assembly protein A domain-containing protein n=1 Tax=Candidatus Endolissoclinum faulkneri L2 TaxID=1193729 RepID=K7YP83_9PROT|nr:LapA family protein [Candidatus Endolissoclinum faulkneri]AFX99342.1 hypothetical protein A1OE_1164 [Candidatus Endolissoclinum faulkneri L2]